MDSLRAYEINKNEERILDNLKQGNYTPSQLHGRCIYGETMLVRALNFRYHSVALYLIELGVDVNELGICGKTPLDYAFEMRNENLVTKLCAKGAKMRDNLTLKEAQLLFDIEVTHYSMKPLSEGYAVLHYLIEKLPFTLAELVPDRLYLYRSSIENRSPGVVKMLLEHNLKVSDSFIIDTMIDLFVEKGIETNSVGTPALLDLVSIFEAEERMRRDDSIKE